MFGHITICIFQGTQREDKKNSNKTKQKQNEKKQTKEKLDKVLKHSLEQVLCPKKARQCPNEQSLSIDTSKTWLLTNKDTWFHQISLPQDNPKKRKKSKKGEDAPKKKKVYCDSDYSSIPWLVTHSHHNYFLQARYADEVETAKDRFSNNKKARDDFDEGFCPCEQSKACIYVNILVKARFQIQMLGSHAHVRKCTTIYSTIEPKKKFKQGGKFKSKKRFKRR